MIVGIVVGKDDAMGAVVSAIVAASGAAWSSLVAANVDSGCTGIVLTF